MTKKFTPKTKPTGAVPTNAKRVPAKEDVNIQTVKAWRVKVVYMQERGRWQTLKIGELSRYRPPKRYDGVPDTTYEDGGPVLSKGRPSVWQSIVDWCEERNINPELYVRQCFATVPFGFNFAPEPGQLLGDKYYQRWVAGKEDRVEEIATSLEIQKDIARRHLTVRQSAYGEPKWHAQIAVLSDGPALGLSPLFCYSLAISIDTAKLRRLARRLKTEAILQFETNRVCYKKLWKDFIPEGFSKESKKLYPQLLAQLWLRRKADSDE